MVKLKLFSTIFSKLGSLTKNNGQIIVTRDSKSLYVDLEGERIEITDWMDIDTEETLLAILTPLTNKYYYTKDSNKIWRYINNDWECLNTSVNDLTPTYTESTSLVKLSSGEKISVAFGKISKAISDLISHISDTVKHITSDERNSWNNKYAKPTNGIPKSDLSSAVQKSLEKADTALQSVTKESIGLGNIDNTSDEDKPVSTAQQAEFDKLNSNLSSLGYEGYEKAQFSLISNKYITVEGDEASYNGWSATDYIDCTNGTKLCVYSPQMDEIKRYNCFYDSNKNFISNFVLEDGYTYIDIPTNASYFRMSGITNAIVKFVAHVCSNLMAEMCNTKNDLDGLEFGEVAGGKNIFQLDKIKCGSMVENDLVLTNQDSEFYEYNWKPNTQYTISFVCRNSTSNGAQRLYFEYTDGSTSEPITNNGTSFDYVSATSEVGKTIKSLKSYWGDIGSLIIKGAEIMIEEGTQATPYEPYIPSVKMLAEEVNAQNESLEDYGLNNVFDGQFIYDAYYSSDDGTLKTNSAGSNIDKCSKNKISCVVGKQVTVKASQIVSIIGIRFYKADGTFISGSNGINVKSYTVTAPTNASYYHFMVESSSGVNVLNIKCTSYMDNALDELKNDLGSKVNFDRILGVNIPCEVDQWTVLDNSVNWFQLNVIPILKTAYQNSSGNQAGGLLRINANTGGIEFKADAYCDYVFVYLLKI